MIFLPFSKKMWRKPPIPMLPGLTKMSLSFLDFDYDEVRQAFLTIGVTSVYCRRQ